MAGRLNVALEPTAGPLLHVVLPSIALRSRKNAVPDFPHQAGHHQGGSRYIVRDFAKLSLGQQQSVLLALMLSADSDRPLLIDQPEDNLDGEFIYTTLVPVLRRAKERRQVIIVTHNANVAVLGDAEQLVVMKAMNDRGAIVARGSIDHPQTRDAACGVLEGAQEAFLRRAKMYGISCR
jgi:ABC-type Mn2+/Zn2+ transport system ATPase subunit